jgi:hypothetical protein
VGAAAAGSQDAWEEQQRLAKLKLEEEKEEARKYGAARRLDVAVCRLRGR